MRSKEAAITSPTRSTADKELQNQQALLIFSYQYPDLVAARGLLRIDAKLLRLGPFACAFSRTIHGCVVAYLLPSCFLCTFQTSARIYGSFSIV